MTILSVTYDLADAATAARVVVAIKRMGSRWAHPLTCVWYVETQLTPAAIVNRLSDLLDLDDGLIVQEVSAEIALSNAVVRWMPAAAPADIARFDGPDNIIAWPELKPRLQTAA